MQQRSSSKNNALSSSPALRRAAQLHESGDLDRAERLYQALLATQPLNVEAQHRLGLVHLQRGHFEEAVLRLDGAARVAPNSAAAWSDLGVAQAAAGRFEKAIAAYNQAIAIKPDFAAAINNRAAALVELRSFEAALADAELACALKPDFARAHHSRGCALAGLGREEEAVASYDKAIALNPRYAAARESKGVALLQLGRLAEANAAMEAAVRIAPKRARAHYHLAMGKRFAAGDPGLAALETLDRDIRSLDAESRIYAHFALGKAYGDVGDVERSFRHWADGAALKRSLLRYDEAKALGDLRRTQTIFSADLLRGRAGAGDLSELPVFVVGMPRSGTTLVEQILASHPAVHGAGEIYDFDHAVADLGGHAGQALRAPEVAASLSAEQLRRIGAGYVARLGRRAPGAARVVNKMPENFRFAGLIALALPKARVIHVKRDPLDTCFSCFSTLFNDGLAYTYDFAELGRYFRAYEALMEAWSRALPPGVMIEVRYEDLIADLEGQSRRFVEHCGLDWDTRCLDFHQNVRSVRTASLEQVRRPLFASSVGRWRPYEAHLQPLLAALGAARPAIAA